MPLGDLRSLQWGIALEMGKWQVTDASLVRVQARTGQVEASGGFDSQPT
jgi:hypothetical protein